MYKDFNSLGNCLRKCGETLNYLDCFNEELFSKINNIDIRTKLFDSFKQHYCNDYETISEAIELKKSRVTDGSKWSFYYRLGENMDALVRQAIKSIK